MSESQRVPAHRDRLERRRVAQRAWLQYARHAEEPLDVPAVILDSWRRCRDAFGIDPGTMAPRSVLEARTLASRLETSEVYRLAHPVLDDFADGLIEHCLAFFDAEGSMLWLGGDAGLIDDAGDIHYRPGVDWSEASAGTNGPGTALACGRPVEVFSSEHYVEAWHPWGSAAAPVTLTGESGPVAVVGVLGRWEHLSRQALHLAMAIARILRERLEAGRAVRAEVVRHSFRAARGSGQAVMAVDGRGNVIAVNDAAVKRPLFGAGLVPPGLRAALDRGAFSSSSTDGEEFHVQLENGLPCEMEAIRFGDDLVGAILRVPQAAASLGGASRSVTPAPRTQASSRSDFGQILGTSAAMRRTVDLARTAALSDLPVVLTGESGTGKELFARAIHAAGPRQAGPFVAVSCGAISEARIEAELLGCEEGTSTGARRGGSPGRFEDAGGGTIFLDDVTELPPQAQAALLRVLQERQVVRLGGSAARTVDVRVVAATSKLLQARVHSGRFRHDLYYRLNVLNIAMTPLRDRGDDVAPLAEAFLAAAGAEMGRTGLTLARDAIVALRAHPWPGNVRELKSVIQRAAAAAPSTELRAADLALERSPSEPAAPTRPTVRPAPRRTLKPERSQLLATIEACQGNFTRTASRLGVSRMTLYRWAHKLHIPTHRSV